MNVQKEIIKWKWKWLSLFLVFVFFLDDNSSPNLAAIVSLDIQSRTFLRKSNLNEISNSRIQKSYIFLYCWDLLIYFEIQDHINYHHLYIHLYSTTQHSVRGTLKLISNWNYVCWSLCFFLCGINTKDHNNGIGVKSRYITLKTYRLSELNFLFILIVVNIRCFIY